MADQQEGTHVYEGKPDDRQSPDVNHQVSRFRPTYRALTQDEKQLHDDIKAEYAVVEKLIEGMPNGRYKSLALTALEESCMWAVKQLTS